MCTYELHYASRRFWSGGESKLIIDPQGHGMRDAMILLPQRTDESEWSARSDSNRGSVHRQTSIALRLSDHTVKSRAENAVGYTRSHVFRAPLFTGLVTDSHNRGLDRTLRLTSVSVDNPTRQKDQVSVGAVLCCGRHGVHSS